MTFVGTDRLLIESAMPTFDVTIAEHVLVAADLPTTFDAARAMDPLTVRTPMVAASLWIRGLPLRLFGAASPPLHRLVIGLGLGLPGWLLLGEQPDREIAFGAVGRFWQPVIVGRHVAPADFAGFAEAGWGKIAASFSVQPYGDGSTLLSCEYRTVTTDPESRRRYLRDWWLIRPFVGHNMRATLNKIKTDAEAATAIGSRCGHRGRRAIREQVVPRRSPIRPNCRDTTDTAGEQLATRVDARSQVMSADA